MRRKQFDSVDSAFIKAGGISVSGGSTNITTALTTAAATAGRFGVAVPLQPSVSNGQGFITTNPLNYIKLFANATQNDVNGANGQEVYGRLTEASNVYTLTFYTRQSGTETAHSFGSATSIDVLVPYRFSFPNFPQDALISQPVRNVSEDGIVVASGYAEAVTVTGTNVLSALTKTPVSPTTLQLIVNGLVYDSFGSGSGAGGARFSLSSKTITWNQSNGVPPFSIDTSDKVSAEYFTLE